MKFLVCVFLFISPICLAHTVYTWTDKQGVTHFSQYPPKDNNATAVAIPTTNLAKSASVKVLATNCQTHFKQLKETLIKIEAVHGKMKEVYIKQLAQQRKNVPVSCVLSQTEHK